MNGLVVLFMIVGAFICAVVAGNKQRNVIGWLIAGALFPLIAVIAIVCLPPLQPPDDPYRL